MDAGSGFRRLMFSLGTVLAIAVAAGAASAAGGVAEGPRLAYLDPGAGSFILQALVAMLAGAIVAVSAYWTKIKNFLGFSKADEDDQDAPGATGSDR
jgi:hypothetical protein